MALLAYLMGYCAMASVHGRQTVSTNYTCECRVWLSAHNPTCNITLRPDIVFNYTADGTCRRHFEPHMQAPDYYIGTVDDAALKIIVQVFRDQTCTLPMENFSSPINTCQTDGLMGWKSYMCARSQDSQAAVAFGLIAHTAAVSPSPCPTGFTCFKDGKSFALALNTGDTGAPSTAKLALLCPAPDPCIITNTQLGGLDGVVATAIMENVLVSHSVPEGENGALLNIASGSVTGTNLTFRDGKEA
jgi:hypothetical protein